jgi:nucleotidyltransferase substrate binding protein (TIGR01987 family)
MSQEVRWQQRFQNFDRALAPLDEAMAMERPLSALEKEGVIQRFEYSYELAWKTLKDYLEASGVTISPITPRQVIKDAFAAKIITDGQVWMNMIDNRNLLSHTYDFAVLEEAVKAIAGHYLPVMKQLHAFFAQKTIE